MSINLPPSSSSSQGLAARTSPPSVRAWNEGSTYLLWQPPIVEDPNQEGNNVINFCGKYNFVTIGNKNISNKENQKCKNRQNKPKLEIKRKENRSLLSPPNYCSCPVHGEPEAPSTTRNRPIQCPSPKCARAPRLPLKCERGKYLLCKDKVK